MQLLVASRSMLPHDLIAADSGLADGIHLSDYARYGLQICTSLAAGLTLLFSRRPTQLPTRAREIFVPLLATFSYLGFNQRMALPAWMTTPFTPVAWEGALAVTGIVLSFTGGCIALMGVLWLGRSMGIVVSVRKVVLTGPYRYVRHPIYLGYMFVFAGMFVAACTFQSAVIAFGAGALLIWRARIEEEFIARHSAEYRERLGGSYVAQVVSAADERPREEAHLLP